VVSDVQGVSARAMLAELAHGNTDAEAMAELARGRLRHKLPELKRALTGRVQAHQRFLLSTQLAHIDFLDEQLVQLEEQIAQQLTTMSQPPAPPQGVEGGSGTAESDSASPRPDWHAAVALLDSVPGINPRTAEVILAEIGLDMRRFPTAGHLARWAGVAPGNHQSGGKRYSGRTTQGNRFLKTTLVQCAHAAARTKGSFLSARYHRLAGRRGKKRALMAVAHSMLVAIWHMLTTGEVFHDLGSDYYDHRSHDRKLAYYRRQLEQLLGAPVQISLDSVLT
jgi:transposase